MATVDTIVTIKGGDLASFLRGPGGPVTRELLKRGDRVVFAAKRLVGHKTGNLESRIVKRVGSLGGVPVVFVGAVGVKYALWHHEGTQPHVIVPRNKKVLRFEVGGAVVFAKRVNHPGTRPNRFLLNALRFA
jgi:hypothetical protein